MAVQNINSKPAQTITGPIGPGSAAGDFVGRRAESRRQLLAILVLVFSDLLLALVVWQVSFVLQGILGNSPLSGFAVVASLVPNAVVWIGMRASLGLYPGYGLGVVEELRRQTLALLATLAIAVVFAFALQVGDLLSRLMLFAWCLGLVLLAPTMRYLVKRAMMRTGLWGKPVVVLGAREAGARVLRALQREWQLGFRPVGVFDNNIVPVDGMLEGVPYRGTVSDAVAMARTSGVDTAIFAMPTTRREHLAKFVSLASNRFRHVVIIPNLDGITTPAVVARDLGETFGIEIKHNLLDPWAQRLKRMLDIGAASLGGLLVLPLVLIICLLVRLESSGPLFYKAQRMGRDGNLFSCVKFCTMVPDAEALLQRMLKEDGELREEYTRYHKLRNDPRVTRVGRFLRKTSLDELPQLWNVLKGEMSLVGPRPYLPRESADIGATQGEILRVTPGITGPWQVSGRNDTSFGERVRMDAYYVRDWSVWLDLVLLARTVRTLILDRGAY